MVGSRLVHELQVAFVAELANIGLGRRTAAVVRGIESRPPPAINLEEPMDCNRPFDGYPETADGRSFPKIG